MEGKAPPKMTESIPNLAELPKDLSLIGTKMKCYLLENICGVLFNFWLIIDTPHVKTIDTRLRKIGDYINSKHFRTFIWVIFTLA